MSSDCWYLYTLHKPTSIEESDQTLEIIMTKLDPKIMDIFTQECSSSAEEATRKSKIDTIFPNAIIDAYLFEPCGYSVNAILPKVKLISFNRKFFKTIIKLSLLSMNVGILL
jgi:S-adenosylmethionine decarboxylase